MKLATIRIPGATVAVRVDTEACTEISGYPDLGALLARADWQEIALSAQGATRPLADTEFAAVVPNPSKVLCVGLNYTDHILEMGRELPAYPTVFAKFADTLTGPHDDVTAVSEDPDLDWEGELVVVIGKTAHKVSEAEAPAYIAGYTIANDISMRGWQARTQEWLQGKIWTRSTPVGPVLVTPDEFDSTQAILETTVNGRTMQKHPVSDLLFTPAHLVSYLSTIIPLRPGDMILTGTPGGVGKGRSPQLYLKSGDRVEVTISGIGSLRTQITADQHSVVGTAA